VSVLPGENSVGLESLLWGFPPLVLCSSGGYGNAALIDDDLTAGFANVPDRLLLNRMCNPARELQKEYARIWQL